MYIIVYMYLNYADMHIDEIGFPFPGDIKSNIDRHGSKSATIAAGHCVHQIQSLIGSGRMHSSTCTKSRGGFPCEEMGREMNL